MENKQKEENKVQGNKELPDISEVTIKNLIHVVRGQQVMLDSDLAKLYQVETKVFNQAVKRNIERFPERFCFQLTKEEYDSLRSQFVTSEGKGGRRYLPYVFTEQGIAMLSAILRSDVAKFFLTYRSMKNHPRRSFLMDRYMMHSAYWWIWYLRQRESWYWWITM